MKRVCRLKVVGCLVLSSMLACLLAFPVIAGAITPAGMKIPSISMLKCELNGAPFRFPSNRVFIDVDQVHGTAIVPPREGAVKPGKSVTFQHKVGNRGNISDSFLVEGRAPDGYLVELYAADGVTPLPDRNADGKFETPPLPMGAEAAIVVKLTAPQNARPGSEIAVTVKASSAADPTSTATVVDRVTILDSKIWEPISLAVSPSGQILQGSLLTYTLTFGTRENISATNVVIADPLDGNLDYVDEGAAAAADGREIRAVYNPADRTLSWRIPALPAGVTRTVTFKARVSPATLSDTIIPNRFQIASDQNPEGQRSNQVGTPVVEQPLRVVKSAGKTEAEIGELVPYTVTVENVSKTLTADAVEVIDTLPKGFRYSKGSSALESAPLRDPPPGTTVSWGVGSLAPGQKKTLTYRALVSIDAPIGDGVNSARATGRTPRGFRIAALPDSARVKVLQGVLNDKAIILGRVFVDLNGDRMPDQDEPGMRGVRLYLENGFFAVTDGEGKFSLVDIDAGEHVLKLDKSTLPPGFQPAPLDSTFAGDGGSRFITVPFGGMARGDFGLIPPAKETAQQPKRQKDPPKEERVYVFGTKPNLPPPTLEQQITTMPDSPDILQPAPGATIANRWSDIVVRGPEGSDYTLRVNGLPLLQKQIGKTIVESQRKIRICQYVGIRLHPGSNLIALEVPGPGREPLVKEVRVFVPGDAEKLAVTVARRDIPADGKSVTPFTVILLDREDRPVTGQTPYTVFTEKGEIVEPDLDTAKPGHQLRAVDGKGIFNLRSTLKTGAERIKVVAGADLEGGADVFFIPQMRDWIVTGLGSLIIRNNSLSGNTAAITKGDSYDEGLQGDGRIAFFAKGTIFDEYLLTAAYDSKKEKRDELFQRVAPDKYYPIYGDASVQGYEAESREKYYLKLEKERSSLLIGDFNTNLSNNEFSRYDRTFNGVKADLDGRYASLRAFGTSSAHAAVRDEIPGNGTSGYYFLSRREIIENSEKIRIEVRDRYHSERVLSAVDKIQYVDYSIDYRTGAILFREPIPSYDANLNPVRIVAVYESEDSREENHIYGGRGAIRSDTGQLGVTAVVEENGTRSDTLFGIDGFLKIGDRTGLKMEAARSDTVKKGEGTAWKTELGTQLEKAVISAYYRHLDENFQNVSMSGSEVGTEKYGAKVTYPLLEKTKLIAEGFVQSDLINDTRLTNTSLGVSQQIDRFTLDSGYRYLRGREDSGSSSETTSSQMIFAGVSGKVMENLEGSLLQEQAFSSATVKDYPSRTLLKLNYKLNEKTSAFITEEFRESGGDKGNNTLFGVTSRLYENVLLTTSYKETQGSNGGSEIGSEVSSKWEPSSDLTLTTRTGYRIQDSMTGERGQALLGVDSSWEVLKGLRLGAKAERVQLVTGTNDPNGINTALALSASYLPAETVKTTARYEYRDAPGETTNLYTLGGAWKMTQSLSLLGKGSFWTGDKQTGTDRLIEAEIGTAYRPLGRNSLYLLGLVRFKDDRKGSVTPVGEIKSLIGSLELSERLTAKLTLHGKYAGKYSWDTLSGSEASSYSDMLLAGATYDLTDRWDLDLSASVMNQYDSGVRSIGLIPQIAYRIHKNVKLALGYNWSRLNDRDLSGEGYSSSGPFVQLKFKFDEVTIEEIYTSVVGKPQQKPPPPAPPPAPKPVSMAVVKAQLTGEPVQILGSVEAVKLVVNDREAPLQAVDARLALESGEDAIELKGSGAGQPVRFRVEAGSREQITSWSLSIESSGGEVVDAIRGTGAPPAEVSWDTGRCSAALKAGEIYRYRLEAQFADGARASGPVRLFGLNRSSSFALSLTGGAFETGSATLSRKAREILREAAVLLRKYKDEKIVVEGHTDSVGSDEANMELSRRRSQAAADFLVNEEKVPAERLTVRWFGKSRPIASNAIPEGRELNRRVEIKGEFTDTKRAVILDQHHVEPFVTVNRTPVPVDEIGRFSRSFAEDLRRLQIEMVNQGGRSAVTSVALPELTVTPAAALRVPCPDGDTGPLKVAYRFTGKTAPGASVTLDGRDLAVAEDGGFSFELEVTAEEASHWLQARNRDGYSRNFRLGVSATREVAGPSSAQAAGAAKAQESAQTPPARN